MITKEYNDGYYRSWLYFYGRIDKNKPTLDALPGSKCHDWQFGYHNCSVSRFATNDGRKIYYALSSYHTTVAFFILDHKKKIIKFYDFSTGYSPSTDRQVMYFKRWLRDNAEGYRLNDKEFTREEVAFRRMERGAF